MGSPLLPQEYDPVTTDPKGEASLSVTPICNDDRVANLLAAQYAGPHSRTDIASYISGYFDGEGCFCVAIAPRPTLKVGWEVRPSLGEPEWRPG